jgi:protein involved in polysaccharide export with SLBB domain
MVIRLRRGSPWAIVAVAAVVLCVSCCQTPRLATPSDPPFAARLRKTGLIHIGDNLEITFSDVPSPAPILTVRVGADGTIILPFKVTLTAAGKTTSALVDDIRAAYVPYPFPNLTTSISILEFGSLVLGEVRSSGHLLPASNLTVLRAIEISGGPTAQADLNRIELRRRNGEVVKVNWNRARQNPKHDPLLTPTGGDVIMVPRKVVSPR